MSVVVFCTPPEGIVSLKKCRPCPGLFQFADTFPAFPRWATVCRPYGTLDKHAQELVAAFSGKGYEDCSNRLVLFGPAAWEGYFFVRGCQQARARFASDTSILPRRATTGSL